MRYRAASGIALVAITALAATGCGDDDGTFDTAEPAQLVATAPQVQIDPILTAGDVVGDYQMSGVPDGLGAYEQEGRIQLYMNHELEGMPSDARVSHLTLNGDRQVVAAEYVLDGSEGYRNFCSSSLSIISGVPTYLTGEEALPGRSIALDATSGEYRKTNQFGYFEHENVIALEGLPFGLFVNTEDGPPDHSQLYAYSADSLGDALDGEGQLLVWKADSGGDSSNDIAKGETLAGRFVPLSAADNGDAKPWRRLRAGRVRSISPGSRMSPSQRPIRTSSTSMTPGTSPASQSTVASIAWSSRQRRIRIPQRPT